MNIDSIKHFPRDPGIYLFKDKKGEILYIGKAKNLQKRVAQYFSPNSLRKQDMLVNATSVDFLIVKTESEALYLEDNLIKKHKPWYNNLLKADNSYVYIKITNEDLSTNVGFPQIFITRKKVKDGSIYIGPKHNTMELKKFIQYLRQVLQFRGCKNTQFKQGKLCSDYHFGLCRGRCTLTKENESKTEYNKIITQIVSFFKGNTLPIEKEIKQQITESVKNQNFEWSAKLRDIYLHIQQLVEKQTVVIPTPVTGYIFKIKNIGNFFIYCILNFYEGKLIDVIRGKEPTEELDINALKSSLEIEFGDFEILNKNKTEILGISEKSKKPKKSDLKEIDIIIEHFFDSFIMSTTFEKENLNNDLLGDLQIRYKLKNFPYRIECIDISHLSGGWVSGGLSCLLGGLKNFKGYRRYKIKGTGGKSDDYASLSELLLRRFTNEKTLPDVLVIDGGKGQLGIIKKLYKEDKLFQEIFDKIDFVSLGKGEARNKTNISKIGKKGKISEKLYYFDEKMNIKSKDLIYDQTDRILTSIRDEAHRFANAYRKKQMKKEFK